MWSRMMHENNGRSMACKKPHGCSLLSKTILQNTDGQPNLKLGLNKTLLPNSSRNLERLLTVEQQV